MTGDLGGEILDAARALGVLSTGAQSAPRILATLCDPAVDAAELSALIAREPGLTARVLRVANSAFYGFSRAIGTVDRAVVVLGLDAVRGVAAAACLDRTVLRANESSPIDLDTMLRHSVAAAAAAEALARPRHPALAPEAFIAGLLHDFGVMIELRLDAEGLAATVASLREDPEQETRAVEERLLAAGHEQCAAVIFEAWHLPASLIDAVRHHHEPAAAPAVHRALTALVHLGHRTAIDCGFGFPLEPCARPARPDSVGACAPPAAILDLAGVTRADLAPVIAELPRRVQELQRALAGT